MPLRDHHDDRTDDDDDEDEHVEGDHDHLHERGKQETGRPMNKPHEALLRVNPDWATLPLFDRTGWKRLPFGAFADSIRNVTSKGS